jgi:hypothetical protein
LYAAEKANGSRARTDEVLMITGGVDELLAEASPLGIKVVTLFMGEVSTNLISPDSISFGPESIYTSSTRSVSL